MIYFSLYPLLRCALDVFATGKRVSHGGKYGLVKDVITKIEENLNETVKQCLK